MNNLIEIEMRKQTFGFEWVHNVSIKFKKSRVVELDQGDGS